MFNFFKKKQPATEQPATRVFDPTVVKFDTEQPDHGELQHVAYLPGASGMGGSKEEALANLKINWDACRTLENVRLDEVWGQRAKKDPGAAPEKGRY